jgi:hypothetical protein
MAKTKKGASPAKGFEPSIRDQVAQNHLQLRQKFFAYDKAVKAPSVAGKLDNFTLRVNRQGEVSGTERARFTAQLELLLGAVQIRKKTDPEGTTGSVQTSWATSPLAQSLALDPTRTFEVAVRAPDRPNPDRAQEVLQWVHSAEELSPYMGLAPNERGGHVVIPGMGW